MQFAIDINEQMDQTNTGNGYSGPPFHTVSLFANPIIIITLITDANVVNVEPGVKQPADLRRKSILYFKPRIQDIGRNFKMKPNKSYYTPGDEIVYDTFKNLGETSGENIKMFGYRTISGDHIKHPLYDPEYAGIDKSWKLIYAEKCANVKVEGISLINSPIRTANVNSIGTKKN